VESKHIYVGDTRIATKRRHEGNDNYGEEERSVYYYHGDHLGSAQLVTDYRGEVYEHLEYTPYGELWVEEVRAGGEKTPFRFTGKRLDEETGLYYYGARYLDPQTSRWLSTDPAMGEYIPRAPIDDEAKRYNGNLPGMGGVYNYVNLHVSHYAGNNPVKYIDPTGMWTDNGDGTFTAVEGDTLWDLYGADWQQKSGYEGDPTKLQIGEIVGKKNSTNESIDTDIASSLISDTLTMPNTSVNGSNDQQNSQDEGRNTLIGIGQMIGGGIVIAIGVGIGFASEGTFIQPAYAIAMSGVTLFAFGFGRTFGGHDKPITKDLPYMIPEPIGTYNEIYKHLK
jgi:RHS repeat-associated protein